MKSLEKHDKTKILFATDSPWSNAVNGIEYIRNLTIDEKDKNLILGENAVRLLNGIL